MLLCSEAVQNNYDIRRGTVLLIIRRLKSHTGDSGDSLVRKFTIWLYEVLPLLSVLALSILCVCVCVCMCACVRVYTVAVLCSGCVLGSGLTKSTQLDWVPVMSFAWVHLGDIHHLLWGGKAYSLELPFQICLHGSQCLLIVHRHPGSAKCMSLPSGSKRNSFVECVCARVR